MKFPLLGNIFYPIHHSEDIPGISANSFDKMMKKEAFLTIINLYVLLLNSTPGLRPTAAECSKVHYFEDVGVKTLANLDAQFQWDNLQKSQFYKGLPQVLPR